MSVIDSVKAFPKKYPTTTALILGAAFAALSRSYDGAHNVAALPKRPEVSSVKPALRHVVRIRFPEKLPKPQPSR